MLKGKKMFVCFLRKNKNVIAEVQKKVKEKISSFKS